MPEKWSATLYVLLELCTVNEDGVVVDDPHYRPVWVAPAHVGKLANIRRAPSVGCSAIWVAGERTYVVGSVAEVYQKLTEPRDYRLQPPPPPAEVPRRP